MTPDDSAGSSRREFLTGRALASEVERTGGALADELAARASAPPSAGHTVRLGTRAMACDFAVIMNPGPARHIMAASEALDLIHRLEDQMTVYREHSELSALNRRAASEPVAVEPRLYELLRLARRISLDTGGAFDPTSGPLIALWRRCRRDGRIPTQEEIDVCRGRTGMPHVRFRDGDPETCEAPPAWASPEGEHWPTISFDRPGIELNLGGIGKGYALDRAGELLRQYGLEDWVIHGGHSSILAAGRHAPGEAGREVPECASTAGCCPGEEVRGSDDALDPAAERLPADRVPASRLPPGQGGWPIGIRNPLFPRENLATVLVRDQALSTSGSGVQHFRHAGRRYGHILDPRTGWPAEGMLSVTVLAPTAAEADALATAFFVLGVEKARRYCDNRPEVQALLVPPPASGRTLAPIVCGIPEDALWIDGAQT